MGKSFFYFFYQQKVSFSNNLTSTSITTFPLQNINNKEPSVENSALNPQTLDSLLILKKGIVSSSVLTNTYTGTLIVLDKKGEIIDGFEYKLKLKIKGNNEMTNGLIYNENDLKNLKVIHSLENNGTAIVDLDKLEIGDNIVITETLDLTKDLESTIIKLEIRIL